MLLLPFGLLLAQQFLLKLQTLKDFLLPLLCRRLYRLAIAHRLLLQLLADLLEQEILDLFRMCARSVVDAALQRDVLPARDVVGQHVGQELAERVGDTVLPRPRGHVGG